VKSLFVISGDSRAVARESHDAVLITERRKSQRRMGIARRIVPQRRNGNGDDLDAERRESADRRGTANRRKRPDRRIGLSPDLDLFLLGI
jgi:hypothetical protein